jgi:hypothetical protein
MSASVPPVWCKQRGASAVLPMQAEAIDWAKNLNPGKSAVVERVRNTDRDPDRWRKGERWVKASRARTRALRWPGRAGSEDRAADFAMKGSIEA